MAVNQYNSPKKGGRTKKEQRIADAMLAGIPNPEAKTMSRIQETPEQIKQGIKNPSQPIANLTESERNERALQGQANLKAEAELTAITRGEISGEYVPALIEREKQKGMIQEETAGTIQADINKLRGLPAEQQGGVGDTAGQVLTQYEQAQTPAGDMQTTRNIPMGVAVAGILAAGGVLAAAGRPAIAIGTILGGIKFAVSTSGRAVMQDVKTYSSVSDTIMDAVRTGALSQEKAIDFMQEIDYELGKRERNVKSLGLGANVDVWLKQGRYQQEAIIIARQSVNSRINKIKISAITGQPIPAEQTQTTGENNNEQ